MGSMTVLLSVLAVFVMISYTNAAGSCPLPSKVYGCTPKCVQDYDCKNGMLCCSNGCNTKSCTDTTQYGQGGGGNNKYSQSGGTGVYCGNVKCSPQEVCKQDSATRRMKCSRP